MKEWSRRAGRKPTSGRNEQCRAEAAGTLTRTRRRDTIIFVGSEVLLLLLLATDVGGDTDIETYSSRTNSKRDRWIWYVGCCAVRKQMDAFANERAKAGRSLHPFPCKKPNSFLSIDAVHYSTNNTGP